MAVACSVGAEPPRVVGDAARLRQVAWNLVSNAVKFTPAGGTVDVRVGREAGSAVLEVRDTGVGMTRDLLPAVFDPFVQSSEGASVRRHGGLGLGLAITKQPRRAPPRHDRGGERRAGTRRHVPRADPEVTRAPAATPAAVGARTDLGGAKVLVVDDEADSRDVLLQLLASWGARADRCGVRARGARGRYARAPGPRGVGHRHARRGRVHARARAEADRGGPR